MSQKESDLVWEVNEELIECKVEIKTCEDNKNWMNFNKDKNIFLFFNEDIWWKHCRI